MWYVVEAVVLLVIFGFCVAGDSKEQEALLKAYNKGWAQGRVEGIELGGASENRRARLWRSLALDRVRKVKQLDESARLLGEALKTAMRERDEARAALAKMMHFAEADDIPDCNLPEWQDALDSARASLGLASKEPAAPVTRTPISLDRLLEIAAEAASLPASEEPAPHA